jgi:hypothetical protein
MPNEIVVYQDNNPDKSPKSWLEKINPLALIKTLANRQEKPTSQEVVFSNEKLCERVATLYVLIQERGEKIVKLGKDQFCRIFINPQNESLEFRIGTREQVQSKSFYGLKGLETIVQVQFDIRGEVFEAVLGDLERQASYMLGSGEYDTYGSLTGGRYMRSVDAIGTFTEAGRVSIPLTDDIKDQMLEKVFEPIAGIIMKETEGQLPRNAQRKLHTFIDIEREDTPPRLGSGE